MLSTENRHRNYKRKDKKRVAKFMPCHDRPYTVVKAFPEKLEYTLCLPNNPQTFPGFHSSLLKAFVPNDPTLFLDREFTWPGAVVTEDGTEENMIDKIVDAWRHRHGKQYSVRWVGYDRDHDEWLSGKLLEDTEALDIWEAENGTEVWWWRVQFFLVGRGVRMPLGPYYEAFLKHLIIRSGPFHFGCNYRQLLLHSFDRSLFCI